jgi:hypothetical protein
MRGESDVALRFLFVPTVLVASCRFLPVSIKTIHFSVAKVNSTSTGVSRMVRNSWKELWENTPVGEVYLRCGGGGRLLGPLRGVNMNHDWIVPKPSVPIIHGLSTSIDAMWYISSESTLTNLYVDIYSIGWAESHATVSRKCYIYQKCNTNQKNNKVLLSIGNVRHTQQCSPSLFCSWFMQPSDELIH